MTRYAILRVPGSGPPALAGPPNVFDTEVEAQARLDEIEDGHLKAHHTHLEILPFQGPLAQALTKAGILI